MHFEDILFNALGESRRTIYDDDDVNSDKSNTSDHGSEGTTLSTWGSVEDHPLLCARYIWRSRTEVVFCSDIGPADGLRSLSRDQLDKFCTQAKFTILSKISSFYIDVYVLSESSLFVYNNRFIVKNLRNDNFAQIPQYIIAICRRSRYGFRLGWIFMQEPIVA